MPIDAVEFAIERIQAFVLFRENEDIDKDDEKPISDEKWSQFYEWFYMACQLRFLIYFHGRRRKLNLFVLKWQNANWINWKVCRRNRTATWVSQRVVASVPFGRHQVDLDRQTGCKIARSWLVLLFLVLSLLVESRICVFKESLFSIKLKTYLSLRRHQCSATTSTSFRSTSNDLF